MPIHRRENRQKHAQIGRTWKPRRIPTTWNKARRFDEEALELKPMFRRRATVRLSGRVARRAAAVQARSSTEQTVTMPGGTIPGHDGAAAARMPSLSAKTISRTLGRKAPRRSTVSRLKGRTDWSRGGHSLYFRDPDGHLLGAGDAGFCGASIQLPLFRHCDAAAGRLRARQLLVCGHHPFGGSAAPKAGTARPSARSCRHGATGSPRWWRPSPPRHGGFPGSSAALGIVVEQVEA